MLEAIKTCQHFLGSDGCGEAVVFYGSSQYGYHRLGRGLDDSAEHLIHSLLASAFEARRALQKDGAVGELLSCCSSLFLWPLIPYEENAEKTIVTEILIISIAPATIKIAPALVAIAGTLSPAHAFVSTIASAYEFNVEKLPKAKQDLAAISANLHQLHKQFYLCI